MDKFLSDWDTWICPVAAFPAFKHQPVAKPIDVDGKAIPYLLGGAAYTCIFTLTGYPVVVIPIEQTLQGLPIGIHLVGPRWQDYQLLNLAQKITEVTGASAHSVR